MIFHSLLERVNFKQDKVIANYKMKSIIICRLKSRNGSQELPPSKKANFIYPASSQRNNLADESDSAMENEIQVYIIHKYCHRN